MHAAAHRCSPHMISVSVCVMRAAAPHYVMSLSVCVCVCHTSTRVVTVSVSVSLPRTWDQLVGAGLGRVLRTEREERSRGEHRCRALLTVDCDVEG
eukprot:3439985-Rhodomonas_salina.1